MTYLSNVLEPHLGLALPVDEGLVVDAAHDVADDQGEHEVPVDAEPIALQRPAGRKKEGKIRWGLLPFNIKNYYERKCLPAASTEDTRPTSSCELCIKKGVGWTDRHHYSWNLYKDPFSSSFRVDR